MDNFLTITQYKNLEEILKVVNRNYVTVSDDDIDEVYPILITVLDRVIGAMQNVSPLFKELYSTKYYGGSFYDGIKVGRPDEFDLDLKLKLPRILEARLIQTDEQGFIKLQMPGWTRLQKDKDLYATFQELAKMKDGDNYLLYNKVMIWIESVVDRALNSLGRGRFTQLSIGNRIVSIETQKNGPAITLKIRCDRFNFDVDLVASFRFLGDKWPAYPFRQYDGHLPDEFLVIPKPPKTPLYDRERYWRLSFQAQEQIMIKGNNFCKPVLRLLKKLRDTYSHNIPSYYIKTVFLWEIEKQQNNSGFWNTSLSFVFMHMLKAYMDMLDATEIPYFWNDKNNLLDNIRSDTVVNIRNLLRRMMNDINKNIDTDLFVIARYLLSSHEYHQVKRHFEDQPELLDTPEESSSCTIL